MYAWARRCGCQSADAADVMQETFASVATAIARFDYEKEGATFRGWLWTITRNKIRDLARNREPRPIGGSEAQIAMQQVAVTDLDQDSVNADSPPSSANDDMRCVRERTLQMLRESFDPRSWRMFWETAIVGRDPSDVAEEMSVSRWAVYKARSRVLQRLQRELSGLE